MNAWVVLPTYNESATIAAHLANVRRVFSGALLVVDDHSPDGTGDIVEQLMGSDPGLHILHRSGKLGLGSAYRDGLRYALDHGAQQVIQMDADGSHDPALIPAILERLTTLDLVLGSRYVPGGSFPIVWYRRWISTLGNTYIRLLLGWGIHDWSTGYKGWRADFLRRVLEQPMTGQGYAWLMETTWIARRLQGRIGELPLAFKERQGGESKFSWRIAAEDITLAWQLHHRR